MFLYFFDNAVIKKIYRPATPITPYKPEALPDNVIAQITLLLDPTSFFHLLCTRKSVREAFRPNILAFILQQGNPLLLRSKLLFMGMRTDERDTAVKVLKERLGGGGAAVVVSAMRDLLTNACRRKDAIVVSACVDAGAEPNHYIMSLVTLEGDIGIFSALLVVASVDTLRQYSRHIHAQIIHTTSTNPPIACSDIVHMLLATTHDCHVLSNILDMCDSPVLVNACVRAGAQVTQETLLTTATVENRVSMKAQVERADMRVLNEYLYYAYNGVSKDARFACSDVVHTVLSRTHDALMVMRVLALCESESDVRAVIEKASAHNIRIIPQSTCMIMDRLYPLVIGVDTCVRLVELTDFKNEIKHMAPRMKHFVETTPPDRLVGVLHALAQAGLRATCEDVDHVVYTSCSAEVFKFVVSTMDMTNKWNSYVFLFNKADIWVGTALKKRNEPLLVAIVDAFHQFMGGDGMYACRQVYSPCVAEIVVRDGFMRAEFDSKQSFFEKVACSCEPGCVLCTEVLRRHGVV